VFGLFDLESVALGAEVGGAPLHVCVYEQVGRAGDPVAALSESEDESTS
jgi:hypothetical protein